MHYIQYLHTLLRIEWKKWKRKGEGEAEREKEAETQTDRQTDGKRVDRESHRRTDSFSLGFCYFTSPHEKSTFHCLSNLLSLVKPLVGAFSYLFTALDRPN